MINKDLEIKLRIDNDKLDDINQKMKSIIGKEIENNIDRMYSIPKELFSDDKKVSDVIRYKIKVKNGTIISRTLIEESIDAKMDIDRKYKRYDKYKKYSKPEIFRKYTRYIESKTYKRIVIIIESPHKYEYSFDYKPIGPAQGKTGIMIEKNIDKILELFDITDGKYILIISNPVQFQASLGSFYDGDLNDSIRTNLWIKLYEIYKANFELRLKIYKPDYILNATTAERKDKVNEAIENLVSQVDHKIQKKESYHPCVWKNGEITMKK